MSLSSSSSSTALLISPPAVPVYLNLDYQFVELGEVAGYLRANGIRLTVLDGCTGTANWLRVATLLTEQHSIVLVHATMDNYEAVERLMTLSRTLNPDVPVAVYGRLVVHSRAAFELLGADVLVLEPDWEVALETACVMSAETRGRVLSPIAGCSVRRSDGTYADGGIGKRLPGTWSLPDLDSLALHEYQSARDRAAGAHQAKPMELAIGMSRGCDDTCGYCPIPKVGGGTERFREKLDEVARYAARAKREYGLPRLSAFAANFTRQPEWVARFCDEMRRHCSDMAWGCVTSPSLLDTPLLREMRAAGCDRVAIGVESLRTSGRNHFAWRSDVAALEELASRCREVGMRLVGFIMIGMPSQPLEDVLFTLTTLDRVGIVPRPMIYTNFRELSSGETGPKAFLASRLMPVPERRQSGLSPRDLLSIIRDWRGWVHVNTTG